MNDLLKIITGVISGKRHPNYDKTVQNAKKLKAFSEGSKDVFEYCKQFDLRETSENFQYKKDLIKPATLELINKIQATRAKIQNANHQRVIKSDASEDIENVLKNFSNGRTPAEWVKDELNKLECLDPNAFLIIETDGTDGSRFVEPYPFVAKSENVLDFKKSKRGKLLYLVVCGMSDFDGELRYTGYFSGFSIVFEPVEKTHQKTDEIEILGKIQKSDTETVFSAKYGFLRYNVTVFKSIASNIPAMQIGYIASDYGFQSAIDTVDASFSNYIRLNVDLKYSVMKAGNPTLLQYRFTNNEVEEQPTGIGFGDLPKKYKPSEHEKKTDGITISINEARFFRQLTPENIPSLSTYFEYVNPDISSLEFLRAEHDRAEIAVLRGIFGTDYNSNPEKVKTATEVFENNSSVHAALISFDTHCLKMWKFIVESVAQLMGKADCEVSYVQDIDYRLTSTGELLQILETLKSTDASPALRVEIEKKVIERVFESKPRKVAMMKKLLQFDPFAGLSESEINTRLASPFVSDSEKKLHLNLKMYFDKIDSGHPNFLSFSDEKMHEVLMEKLGGNFST